MKLPLQVQNEALRDADGEIIAECYTNKIKDLKSIAKIVNQHDKLVAMLGKVTALLDGAAGYSGNTEVITTITKAQKLLKAAQ